jgi:hypothetical protein
MANKQLKTDVGNVIGLAAADSKLGTDVNGCRVYVHNTSYRSDTDTLSFVASYFWNLAALNTYLANPSADVIRPFLNESYSFNGLDETLALRDQCLSYLLTLPRFATGWVKA